MKPIAKVVAWVLVLASVFFMFTNMASAKDRPFIEGLKEGYDSVDPICEDHWFKRCPTDGSAPYWSWKRKPQPPIIEDIVVPTTKGTVITVEDDSVDG